MNIEGAEFDIIKDLAEREMAHKISGYYVMWDDLSKINARQDAKFRAFMAENSITSFTFNGRDFKVPGRIACIEYDIHTSLLVSVKDK
jgi:hypothetical protein